MAGSKMTRKKPSTRKRKAPIYRGRFVRKLEMADAKPSTAMVKFQGTKRFVFEHDPVSGANRKTIMRIPANYMGFWVNESGLISQDDTANLIGTSSEWYDKYHHYHVLGSSLSVTARPKGTPDGQNTNILSLARVAAPATYSGAVSNHDIEKAFGVNTKWTRVAGGGATESARSRIGYLPSKTFGVKDVTDNNALRCQTNFNAQPNDGSFFNVILMGALDSDLDTHSTYIVDVKVSYTVKFSEPKIENAPTLMKA